jgi:predicted Rossmann fold flavoprotein
LIGAFQRFQASDTVAWFEQRDVKLKTEADGRMFPVTDASATIIDCLMTAARRAGVELRANCGVDRIEKASEGFLVHPSAGEPISAECVLLATGGARTPALARLATDLGHTIEPPVPSLFTLHVDSPWLRDLAGIATQCEVTVPGTRLRERGPMLITHVGVSGPAVLRLSAWGARALHDLGYQFPLHVNWLPDQNEEKLTAELQSRRSSIGARAVANATIAPLPNRLWAALVGAAGIPEQTRWAELSRAQYHALTQQLLNTVLPVAGKTLNKDEFVTCGGVRLGEVNFKTMESRICPGLYFAGELLDIDGITGGFNFQAAWTTGWIAGGSMAKRVAGRE